MRNELPEQCYSVLPSTGELILIKRGERGYYQTEWSTDNRERNEELANSINSRLCVTPAQLEAMICGSMRGWDIPGAQAQFYLDHAIREKSIAITGHIKHPILSIYCPVKGYLYTYRIIGKTVNYIDFISMPKSLIEDRFGYTYFPEMVCGKPMIPVTYYQGQNGSYTLILENGSFRNITLEQEGYTTMAAVRVGEREIAIGVNLQSSPRYVIWERMLDQSPSPAHIYHQGNYCEPYEQAMKNCENRIVTAYAQRCRGTHCHQKKQNNMEKER